MFLPIKQISLREVRKIIKYNHLLTEKTAHVLASTPQVTGSLETGHYELGLKAGQGPSTRMTCY